MPNLQKLNQNKEKILSTIRIKGPTLPVQVAKVISLSPLFASAFLSELYNEKRIKISNMKVGSSPLYYIEGQESLLENFVQYLDSREREAFELLKKNRILEDEKQAPVVRVALQSIKDFAIPIKVRLQGEIKIFWKYSSLSSQEFREEVQRLITPPKPRPIPVQKPTPNPAPVEPPTPPVPPAPKPEIQKPIAPDPKPKTKETEFSRDIKEYLEAKDIEILELISEKKKEFMAKIRIDSLFGKQEYLLIAKDKKSITDNDLTIAIQKAQAEKMLALVLSSGDLNKKGKEHLKEWKNLVKYEKLNF